MVTQVTRVLLDGVDVGALALDLESGMSTFQYTTEAWRLGVEMSPIKMPLSRAIYSFPELPYETFKGLPGLIADSLPDDFGNAVLDSWLAGQGRQPNSISALERLQYIGRRGMGALEFAPPKDWAKARSGSQIRVDQLVELAQEVLDQREQFRVDFDRNAKSDPQALIALLSVGTSAGGARPKAVLAFNDDFSVVRSGQVDAPEGFTHYLMKFDGVTEKKANRETFGDPIGYGAMEYVYYLIAQRCGVHMMPCRLLPEGARRHFITQRFDRFRNNKIHTQTLSGLEHLNYKAPGTYSYEQVFSTARKLGLQADEAEQLLRRAAFNVIMRNHDDHPKNFAFQIRSQRWCLAPAYDLAFSYKPGSKWVEQHWMSLNGKRDNFDRTDFYALQAISPRFTKRLIDGILDQTLEAASMWPQWAREHEVPIGLLEEVWRSLRVDSLRKNLA